MRNGFLVAAVLSLFVGLAVPATGQSNATIPDHQINSEWFQDGQQTMQEIRSATQYNNRPKNVILFIGDGMGVSTVSAARILEGQLRGEQGEENVLAFEEFDNLAMSKTYSTNQQVSDSAPTATAMVTGVKTDDATINIDSRVQGGNCAASKGGELLSFFMMGEDRGKATGVVSTAEITHATPAVVYAQTPNRNWAHNGQLPAEAVANGCKDIARQLIEFPYGDGLEVALGGGRPFFLPNTVQDPENPGANGSRSDGRNLAEEWAARPGAEWVYNKAGFEAIGPETTKLLGLFERSHMQYEIDRNDGPTGEPSLTEMTLKAIDMLERNPRGYTLMVESGRIDHAHHAANAFRALTETIELSNTVRATMERVDLRETLVVVTADHSHVFTMAGYPAKGNPIMGLVKGNLSNGSPSPNNALASDGWPYTTLGYANGPVSGRSNLSAVDTTDPNFRQPALVPMGSETHSGEDVPIYAAGASAHLFKGTVEQSYIGYTIIEQLRFNR